jgi:hypothetical protein
MREQSNQVATARAETEEAEADAPNVNERGRQEANVMKIIEF